MNAEELRAASIRRRTNDWLGNRMYNSWSDEDADARLLADAYLSEHPADDGEELSDDWLKCVGFAFHADCALIVLSSPIPTDPEDDPRFVASINPDELLHRIIRIGKGQICEWAYFQPRWWNDSDSEDDGRIKLPYLKTRGDLRRACKVFNITLQGAAP